MKKLIIICLILLAGKLSAQRAMFSKNVRISFSANTVLEKVAAINNKATSVWDPATGTLEFSVLVKGFEFEKALMQEHFNENYMESDLYPKAVFKGVMDKNDMSSSGSFHPTVTGILTLHGVSNKITVPVTMMNSNGKISAVANFTLTASDYKIKIPAIVSDKINKNISVRVVVPEYQNLK